MNELVQTSKDGEIGILTVNNPPVNALSPGVPEGILAGIEQFEKDDTVKAMVLIGGGRTFIAGADIREFGKLTSGGDQKRGPGFNVILNRIETASKPVIMAIHGTAFGGGLELPWPAITAWPRPRASRSTRSEVGTHPRGRRHAAVAATGRCRESG